jgi:ribosomal protein S11
LKEKRKGKKEMSNVNNMNNVRKGKMGTNVMIETEGQRTIMNVTNETSVVVPTERERDPVRCRVTATINNTKVVRTWYDHEKGKRINRVKTAGSRGYKNAKRGTVYAAQERGAYVVKTYGKEREGKGIHLHRRGMGVGRAVRLTELEKGGRKRRTVSDATKDAHNGCRRKKQRRI